MASSFVRFSYQPPRPSGLGCAADRRVQQPLSFSVRDNAGQESEAVAYSWAVFDGDDCVGVDDAPVLTSTGQTPKNGAIAAGDTATLSFTCSDPDTTGSDPTCDRIEWRKRRLNDGSLTTRTAAVAGDGVARTFTTSFPTRGVWVVEAQLCGQGDCSDRPWWRVGGFVVDDGTAPTVSLSFAGPGVVFRPRRLSVNAGDTADAVIDASDESWTGAIQAIDSGLGLGRFEFATPTLSAQQDSLVHQLAGAATVQPVGTATPGVQTIVANVYDNGAFDGSDAFRRATVASGALRVNARPSAEPLTIEATEDVAASITLAGHDPDNQPAGLTYEIVSQPAHGTVSAPSGAVATYNPPANFHGTTSFTYRVKDGPVAGAAWAYSPAQTVTVDVAPVTDPPVAYAQSITTDEDVTAAITLGGTDGDGDPLTFAIVSGPSHGQVTCTDSDCTYAPEANYHGSDQFIYRVTDSHGDSDTATIGISVTSVNDRPVAQRQVLSVDEDGELEGVLVATDVDGDTITYEALDVSPAPSHFGWNAVTGAFFFRPPADYNGFASVQWRASDGKGGTSTAYLDITVRPIPDAPVATPQSVSTDEDVPLNIALSGTDRDGDFLRYTIVSAPSHGSLTCRVSDGRLCTYTPDPEYSGADEFEFRVYDSKSQGSTAKVSITVNLVDDPPVAGDQTLFVDEDTRLTGYMTATDVDNDQLKFTAFLGAPAGSSVAYSPSSGFFTFEAPADYNGPAYFTFKVSDPNGGTDTGRIDIVVRSVNDPPVIADQSQTTDEDTETTFALVASDADGDPLAATVTTAPAHGAATCSDLSCTYAPVADYAGTDTMDVTVTDPEGASATATVTLTVNPVQDPPVAHDQMLFVDEDTRLTGYMTATDVDNDTLKFTAFLGAPAGSSVAYSPSSGFFTFEAPAHYNGPAYFTFKVSDPNGGTDTGRIDIVVRPVNDPPVAQAQSVATDEDTDVEVTLTGSDPVENDPVTFSIAAPPAHGAVTCTGSDCVYTPAADYFGSDAFDYQVSDGNGGTATETITITVRPVNDPPVAGDSQMLFMDEGTQLDGTMTATDVDGDTLTFRIVFVFDDGTGTVDEAPDGAFTYHPPHDFFGNASIKFHVSDGHGGTAWGEIKILVRPVNDPPVASDQSVTTDEDTPQAIKLEGGDPTDYEVAPVSYSIVRQPTRGSVACDDDRCVYTPAADQHGSDSFDFQVTDNDGATATATVTITIRPVNDTPVAHGQSVATDEDTVLDIRLSADDVDGDEQAFTAVQPDHGTLACEGADCRYRPDADYNGSDSFTFAADDGHGATDSATVDILVRPVNDAPAAHSQSVATDEDSALDLRLSADDVDSEVIGFSAGQPDHGTLVCEGADCRYRPDADYNGTDSFTFTAADGDGATDSATVDLVVRSVNDAPVVADQSFASDEDTALEFDVAAGDVDGDTLSAAISTFPSHGFADCRQGLSCAYLPEADYHGTDALEVTVSDGKGGTATATVTITIRPVNDAPVAHSQSVGTDEDSALDIRLSADDVDGR